MSRFDEKLIQFAYDELNETETKKLSELVSTRPDLQDRVRAIRATHKKLNLLKEIPEPQLSTERLRDAILGQGLKPVSSAQSSRPISQVAVWGGFAAALSALVGIYVSHGQSEFRGIVSRSQPDLVSSPKLDSQLVAVSNKRPLTEAAAALGPNFQLAGAKNRKSEVRVGKSGMHRVDHSSLLTGPIQVIDAPRSLPASLRIFTNLGDSKAPSLADGRPRVQGKHQQVPATGSKHGFMMIDGDQDAATGLPKAKEVADDGHVVLSS